MTSHKHRSTFNVPDDQRCEAIAKPVRSAWQVWQRYTRRCQRPANQCRLGRAVCHMHARAKTVIFYDEKPK